MLILALIVTQKQRVVHAQILGKGKGLLCVRGSSRTASTAFNLLYRLKIFWARTGGVPPGAGSQSRPRKMRGEAALKTPSHPPVNYGRASPPISPLPRGAGTPAKGAGQAASCVVRGGRGEQGPGRRLETPDGRIPLPPARLSPGGLGGSLCPDTRGVGSGKAARFPGGER